MAIDMTVDDPVPGDLDVSRAVRAVPDDELDQHRKRLTTAGYTQVRSCLSPEAVAHLLSMVRAHYEVFRSRTREAPPEWQSAWLYNLQNKDKRYLDLLGIDWFERLLMAKLNDPWFRHIPADRPNYILGQFLARSSGKALILHIDAGMPQPGPETTMVQAAFHLEDSTPENGCTVIAPGSHLLGEYSDRDMTGLVEVPAKAGDLSIWDARVWHGTRENSSGGTRWAIVATFQRWWVKQSFDMPRALPDEIYRQLNAEQKALLGFCSVPPRDEFDRITRSIGYDGLPASLPDRAG
jgi:hypothetical protein